MDRRLSRPAERIGRATEAAVTAPGFVRIAAFVVSLAAFVLVRTSARGLPWWLSLLLAVVAMLVAGRLAGVVAQDLLARVHRRRRGRAPFSRR